MCTLHYFHFRFFQCDSLTKHNRSAYSVLGEQPRDTTSKVELNKNDPNVTTNVRLHLELPEDPVLKVWGSMEESTYNRLALRNNPCF